MFKNRQQAGQLLAAKLAKYKAQKNVIIFAIPRGAVVMGKIIAKKLQAPLDLVVVKKIGAPNNPELAIGAIGPEKTVYWDYDLLRAVGATKSQISNIKSQKEKERNDREKALRGKKQYPSLKGKTVLVVDDGVATGATSIASGKFVRQKQAKKCVLVTPVIAKDTLRKIKRYFDSIIYLDSPDAFGAVGQFYEEFPQVTDQEVMKLLSN